LRHITNITETFEVIVISGEMAGALVLFGLPQRLAYRSRRDYR
jgi:hypothetical protein